MSAWVLEMVQRSGAIYSVGLKRVEAGVQKMLLLTQQAKLGDGNVDRMLAPYCLFVP